MHKQTIRGVLLEIDDDGFVKSPLGALGHIEECEALAELLQTLFDITDEITL